MKCCFDNLTIQTSYHPIQFKCRLKISWWQWWWCWDYEDSFWWWWCWWCYPAIFGTLFSHGFTLLANVGEGGWKINRLLKLTCTPASYFLAFNISILVPIGTLTKAVMWGLLCLAEGSTLVMVLSSALGFSTSRFWAYNLSVELKSPIITITNSHWSPAILEFSAKQLCVMMMMMMTL